MSESKQHNMLKYEAKERFQNLGYELISFDRLTVNGYRPDIILENDEEVLFVEIVATSDHVLEEGITYNNKPVRFIKYYTLDSWIYSIFGRVTMYPIIMSVRITEEIYMELPKIAAFEQLKPATLCRQELLKMVRRYQRNPQYKRWLKRTGKAFKR